MPNRRTSFLLIIKSPYVHSAPANRLLRGSVRSAKKLNRKKEEIQILRMTDRGPFSSGGQAALWTSVFPKSCHVKFSEKVAGEKVVPQTCGASGRIAAEATI
jgi:hypothetical protein